MNTWRAVVVSALMLVCLAPAAAPAANPAAGLPAAPRVKAEQWREDLKSLATELPRLHKNLFFRLPRADFERSVADLERAIPSLREDQIIVAMMRIVASVGDAHTGLSPWPTPWSRLFPLQLYWFKDGLYVTATTAPNRRALAARLASIGDTPIEQVLAAVGRLIPHDNDAWLKQQSPTYLVSPEILHALGILPGTEKGRYVFQDAQGGTFALEVGALSQQQMRSAKRLSAPDPAKVPAPRYLRETGSNYWAEYLKDSQTVYVQYNRCENMGAMPFAAFSEKLMALADANPVRRFVVDLRHNGGGNSALAEPLIAELKQRPAINRKGVLFAVIGRRTFSSAVLNALQLRSETQATLVGEPTGGRPNHYGEVRSFSLPNSGLPVTYSTKYFAYAKEDTPSLTPDILVEVSSSDYFAGRDPVLEAILKS